MDSAQATRPHRGRHASFEAACQRCLHTEYLDTISTARLLGLSARTLEKWRVTGGGPPYIRLGRRVVYSVEDLRAYVESRRRTSTSDGAERHTPVGSPRAGVA